VVEEEFLSGIVGAAGFEMGRMEDEVVGGSSEGLTQFPAPPRPVCRYSGGSDWGA